MDGAELRKQREALGLSQQELGDLLAVPQNTISRWELGKARILHPRILALALRCLAQDLRERDE
jgi:transcriptional regulator with XRE-family HTH domain